MIMAKVKKNVLLDHITGKIGGLVFREVGGQTILSKAPSFGKKRYKKPNKGCTNFKKAAEYARGVQDNPEIITEYSQKARDNQAANQVASAAAPTADPEIWAYTVGAEYESTRGLVARAFAWDRPENKAEGTVIC